MSYCLVIFEVECNLDFLWLMQNQDVTEAIQKVAAAYDCRIVEGVLSHQMKQFVIDGNKVVLNVTSPEMRVDDAEFEENEVYAIDIVTTTGDGKVSSCHVVIYRFVSSCVISNLFVVCAAKAVG